jgi:hypothetical protein
MRLPDLFSGGGATKIGRILTVPDGRWRYRVMSISLDGRTVFTKVLDASRGNYDTGVFASVPMAAVDWEAGTILPGAEIVRYTEE